MVGLILLTLCGSALADGPVFSKPDRIRYDQHSLIIDGKPILIYSGSIHYFRCPKPLWKDRLQRLKDAGLNCVETYLAWNYHEPDEPASPDDFSKLQKMDDIGDFIATAQSVGLYVIIRPGPYICAEWDRGGIPGWVMKHRPAGVGAGHYLRGDSPEMLAWDRHWITAAAKEVRPHLVTNLPPGEPGVILWQLENEYDFYNSILPAHTRVNVLRSLAQDALDNGIDIPLQTCVTKDPAYRADPLLSEHVVETTNSYPGFNMNQLVDGIEQTARYQPERYRGISELQGGWFAQVGGKLSDQQGHNAAQINQLTLVALEHGVTSMNYYMFYGGSNFDYWAARGLIQSYDYNAPIREWGGIGDRYLAVSAIGHMLQQYGPELVRSERIPLEVTDNSYRDVVVTLRRGEDGSRFYFVRTPQNDGPRSGSLTAEPADRSFAAVTIHYDLPAFGAQIYYLAPGATDGQWLPQPVAAPTRPTVEAAALPVTIEKMRADAPGAWIDVPHGAMLPELNVFNQRYVYYRAAFNLSDEEAKSSILRVDTNGSSDNAFLTELNGAATANPTTAIADGAALSGPAAGQNQATVLFENLGCPNFGTELENEQGLAGVTIASGTAPRADVTDWRMKFITGKIEHRKEAAVDYDDSDWTAVSVSGDANIPTPKTNAVFRGRLNVSDEQLAAGVAITFNCIDDLGSVYVNGQYVGHADSWARPWTFDITSKLHEGENIVAVVVRNVTDAGGLYNGVFIQPPGKPVDQLQISPLTQGEAGHWETADTSDWQPYDANASGGGLIWYRASFAAPSSEPNLRLPWSLHIEANANAFVYLNGHLLGRYYAVGPQSDFWLPECWLKTGDGDRNIVALQARPTGGGPVIKVLEVRPKIQFAESIDP